MLTLAIELDKAVKYAPARASTGRVKPRATRRLPRRHVEPGYAFMRIFIITVGLFLACQSLRAQDVRSNEDSIREAIAEFVYSASHTSDDEKSRKLFRVRTILGGTIGCVEIYPERLEFKSLTVQTPMGKATAEIEIGCHGGGDKAYENAKKIGLEFRGGQWIIASVE